MNRPTSSTHENDSDLVFIQRQIFEPNGLDYSEAEVESESRDYLACSFKVDGQFVRYRQGKVTPTKTGQFVTIWKRSAKGPIQPYDASDEIDLLVVTVKTLDAIGQFIFPKTALVMHAVLSVNGKGGKRALRVYPPWDKANSKQAEKTQNWQLDYYAEIKQDQPIDLARFKSLYQPPRSHKPTF